MRPVEHVQVSQAEPIKKASTASEIIEAEGLEAPSESVEFAQYMHNHMGKTAKAKSTLSKISKVTMVIAIGSLAYVCFTLMTTMKFGSGPKSSTGHARLRATMEEDDNSMSMTLNALSVMVWGMVAAKAKAGMNAANSDDHTTVKGMLKKATNLILMIVFASFVKFGAEMSQKQTKMPFTKHPTLQAAHKAPVASTFVDAADAANPFEKHAASFYDPTSSHFMGGAHNVALAHLSDPNNAMFSAPVQSKSYKGAKKLNKHMTAYEALLEGRFMPGQADEPVVGSQGGSILNQLGGIYKNG